MPEARPRSSRAVRSTLRDVACALERCYGTPDRPCAGDPLEMLVATILSQNTTSANCRRAFTAMQEAFPTWDDVLAARPIQLEQTLRPAGLARIRSARIQGILRAIHDEHGRLTLDHLRDLSDEEARKTLLAFEGVGPKTADCVLLFALGRTVFPVDTHIHRILTRLGLLPTGTSVEKAHAFLLPLIPRRKHLSLHLNLIHHGRRVCRPSRPACAACPLAKWCSVPQLGSSRSSSR